MPAASHPQAKFDPISPTLHLPSLIEEVPNLKWAQRVSRTQLRNLGPQEFEKLVLMHVIMGGKPLVIDGLDAVLPRDLFSADWLEKQYDKKEEKVRDIVSQSDVPMTTGHYLRSMKQLANQWTPTNFRDERRQRLYLKDIDCPLEWHEALRKIINPVLFYLNRSVANEGSDQYAGDDASPLKESVAPAGDLMSSLPKNMRAENLMCYIGHEGTYTPAHREMCASLGQNIMVEASGDENGEKPGSSIWFMTESKDRAVVREYFLSMLGHDIEIEKHFAQVNAWKKAPFDVYVVEQRVGDFILVPPLAAHQVWNRGTRTMKVAWNRTTVETLELALQEALPKARLVCRDEQYKNKALIYYTLQSYYRRLKSLQDGTDTAQISFIHLGRDALHSSPRAKQLASDFKKLFALFTQILVDEVFAFKEKEVEYLPFDSCITCSYCRANIFNRFLTCKNCVRTLINGDEDTYDVCMECYAMGRSCACLSGLQWCEQWSWSELVSSHEIWRSMVILNDGFIDIKSSPQPLEVAKQLSGKKTVAQICQEALRRRPWKDITQPEREPTPSESDEVEGEKSAKSRKSRKKKNKKGDVRRCHVCCHKEFSYRVQMCSNPDCSEGYCFGVLYRAFDMMPQQVLQDEHWMCPKCLGICNCGHCRRSGNTKPYTPKNTSLGHDTRSVADDRSVEALVDFRLHNLAWLKAAGEESRGQDTKRMQRLREQADTAKAEELANEQPEEENPETTATLSPRDSRRESGPRGILNAGGMHEGQNGSSHSPCAVADANHQGKFTSLSAPWLHSEDTTNNPGGDSLSYPDPHLFAAQRIGMGYYDQDDTPDKILFDPYQAPTAETVREDDLNIPEFVKKSIRSAKRKAKKENEDPDFIVRSHHRKRPKPPQEPDFLDSMDPALFNEDPTPSESGPSRATELVNIESVDLARSGEPRKNEQPRYEPLLRHAKPRASYVEIEDAEIEDENDMQKSDSPPPVSGAAEVSPVPITADAAAPVDQPSGVTNTLASPETLESPFPGSGAFAGPKKRDRPAGQSRAAAIASEIPLSPDRAASEFMIQSAGQVSEGEATASDARSRKTSPVRRRGPGRPKKSGPAAHIDAKQPSAEVGDTSTVGRVQASKESRRGRPPASHGSRLAPTKKPGVIGQQFTSLAERMALRGKKFKIATRGRNSSPVVATDSSNSTRVEKPAGMTIQLPVFTAANKSTPSSQVASSWKTVGSTTTPNLRLKSDEFEDMTEDHTSESESGSSDDDDIPARLHSTTAAHSSTGAAPKGGRGGGRPRGRPSMRSRGRGRG